MHLYVYQIRATWRNRKPKTSVGSLSRKEKTWKKVILEGRPHSRKPQWPRWLSALPLLPPLKTAPCLSTSTAHQQSRLENSVGLKTILFCCSLSWLSRRLLSRTNVVPPSVLMAVSALLTISHGQWAWRDELGLGI